VSFRRRLVAAEIVLFAAIVVISMSMSLPMSIVNSMFYIFTNMRGEAYGGKEIHVIDELLLKKTILEKRKSKTR